jgi:hypothetical protein
MFAAVPLLLIPILIYNAIALGGGLLDGGLGAAGGMTEALFSLEMHSGVEWPITPGDLLIVLGLVLMFIELLKSTSSRKVAIINHSLSMLLFIACLVEFLLLEACATSVFFILSLMVLLDVLAGFIVTIMSAKRDMTYSD